MSSADEIAELWREALARPDDDGVRAVLADLLQANNDPRGELIALQLLSPRDSEGHARQARIQQLLVRHGREWLGPLHQVARAARFERGFLQAFELSCDWEAGDERFEHVLGDRRLLTVEELLAGTVGGDVYARFLASPMMTALRGVEVDGEHALRAFASCTLPLSHVACKLDWSYRGQFDRLLDACRVREELWSIAISAPQFDQLAAVRWFERLRAVHVACGARRGLALWPRMHGGGSLAIVSSIGLEPCSAAFPWDYRIALTRSDDGVVARVAGEWLLQSLGALAALPREVTRIEIEHTSEVMARRVSEAVARPGVEVIVRPPRRAGNFTWAPPIGPPR